MARVSIALRAVAASLLIASLFPSPALPADTAAAPFSYAWKIVFRGKEIGHALSRFSYRDIGGEQCLIEEGAREFSIGRGVITIAFSEETNVVWDRSGLMKTYVSRSAVNGHGTERRAERRTDGSIVWKTISEGKTKEKLFTPGEFAYTDGDRFFGRLEEEPGPRTLRILSLSKGKVVSITYRFLGREVVDIGDTKMEASLVAIDGPSGEGTFSIDGDGIALGFTMDTFFGDFSFIPTGRK